MNAESVTKALKSILNFEDRAKGCFLSYFHLAKFAKSGRKKIFVTRI